ncbi:hypothetical protein K7432_006870 [Basidiobolus ranarum]|uniref:Peptide hydrolase n=1 Tax=Basidiobolus ranarum TaxID=34480 RepID=A0ABR2WUB7_9FUNG
MITCIKQRLLTTMVVLVILGILSFAFATNYRVKLVSYQHTVFNTTTIATKPRKTTLDEQDLQFLHSLSVPDRLKVDGALLKPLLVPRVSGTQANRDIQEFIKGHFRKLGWNIEEDRFNDTTPLGVKNFNNIIASKVPNASRKLILAAHFDSKYFKDEKFVGAIDSAVPCAILLDVASTLDKLLLNSGKPDVGLELVFFDGEEAFVEWTQQDSVYGARHLADKWATTPAPNGKSITRIEAIELFVLLDLIGAKGSTIWNLQYSTTPAFKQLAELERRFSEHSYLTKSTTTSNSGDYFRSQLYGGGIDDDHRPFLQYEVPIVHLIPAYFPDVWHQVTDNADAVDHDTVVDMSLIMRAFVAEYLQLLP